MIKIRVYKDHKHESRWKAIEPNGRIIADGSEGYDSNDGAEEGFMNLAEHIRRGDYEIVVDAEKRAQ